MPTHQVSLIVTEDGQELVTELELAEGELCVVGRLPTAVRLEGAPAKCRLVGISSPSVSTNHVALWVSDAEVQIRDLGSRNGTWLRVRGPDQHPGRLVLQLGVARPSEERAEKPRHARWSSRDDFGRGIVAEVAPWLAKQGVAADVELSTPPEPRTGLPDDPACIPLLDGRLLRIRFRSTVDARWRTHLRKLWAWVQEQNEVLRSEELVRGEGQVLVSDLILRAHRQVVEASRRNARVLLMGPSGSGKEGLARAYHRHATPNGPFVAVNCSLFRKELLQSQLFGAEAGSFTGSTRRIIGAVERANGGTLFLDELGELDESVQPALLRFLDHGEYERLGEYGVNRKAEVRIAAATNKDLRAAVLRGEFRADLWFRLAAEVIDVSPLRERPEDLAAFLEGVRLRSGASVLSALDSEVRALMKQHPWEGNFRELSNFANRLAALEGSETITLERCVQLLNSGSLTAVKSPSKPAASASGDAGTIDWAAAIVQAGQAFEEDHGQRPPTDWDDVKELIEKYFKPLVFAGLSGASADPINAEPQRLAVAVNADRGTVAKQLSRYLERFVR